MAYPDPVPTGTRINTPPQVDLHPADHNQIHTALTGIVNELGANPSGDFADVTAHFAGVCPLGVVLPFAGAAVPNGWTLCDGTALSRTTFAELFNVIGVTYGDGDGTTTFNVPDLRNRMIAGRGSDWAPAIGVKGGYRDSFAVAHTHGTASHTHTTNDHYHGFATGNEIGNHYHTNLPTSGYWLNEPPVGLYIQYGSGVGVNTAGGVTTGNQIGSHTHSGNTGWATDGNLTYGSAPSTNSQSPTSDGIKTNLPPYITLNMIIRIT